MKQCTLTSDQLLRKVMEKDRNIEALTQQIQEKVAQTNKLEEDNQRTGSSGSSGSVPPAGANAQSLKHSF